MSNNPGPSPDAQEAIDFLTSLKYDMGDVGYARALRHAAYVRELDYLAYLRREQLNSIQARLDKALKAASVMRKAIKRVLKSDGEWREIYDTLTQALGEAP